MDDQSNVEFDYSMSSDVFTVQEEIGSPKSNHYHVVILGAGASLAAFPNGDRNGQTLPVIKNLVDVVGLAELLSSNGMNPPYDDFEGIYSDIAGPASSRIPPKSHNCLSFTISAFTSSSENLADLVPRAEIRPPATKNPPESKIFRPVETL
jgi:hypothetical protein